MGYATAAIVLAAVVSAAAAIHSGRQSAAAADTNARIMEAEAEQARTTAQYNADIHREKVRRALSAQRAMHGRTGLDTSGTPLLVLEDTAEQGELDALVIKYGGDIAAAGKRSGAYLQRMQGRTAETLGYMKAGSTLLGAAAQYKAPAKSEIIVPGG